MKKFFISFMLSLAVVSLLGFYLFTYSAHGQVQETGQDLEEAPEVEEVKKDNQPPEPVVIIEEVEEEPIRVLEDNEITFIMLGVDALDGQGNESMRTDTIMVFKCNFTTGEMEVLSIPRDTRLLVKGKYDKVNHAHNYGGVKLSLETINDFLGTDISYYVKIDYRAVKEIVDSIGGVDIYVPRRMEYYDPSNGFRVDLYEGQQVLDGEKSMQFLRWRTNNSYTAGYKEGDVGRIQTQQYFLKEFTKQTLAPKNILKLPFLARTYFNRVETNIPLTQIINGMRLGRNLDSENIRMETIPGYGTYIDDVSYYVVYQGKLQDLLVDMGFK